MRALEYRVIPSQSAPRLRAKMVDIAIYGASAKMTGAMLRQAKNRLVRHRAQAEQAITHLLVASDLGRYRDAS